MHLALKQHHFGFSTLSILLFLSNNPNPNSPPYRPPIGPHWSSRRHYMPIGEFTNYPPNLPWELQSLESFHLFFLNI